MCVLHLCEHVSCACVIFPNSFSHGTQPGCSAPIRKKIEVPCITVLSMCLLHRQARSQRKMLQYQQEDRHPMTFHAITVSSVLEPTSAMRINMAKMMACCVGHVVWLSDIIMLTRPIKIKSYSLSACLYQEVRCESTWLIYTYIYTRST
jgi:hypothetical protein